ncbi:hypothetical protein BC937DRAFT_93705 [Endogone sp. FLAS-F59071]|nr:hypothetical protein BC937DRAFT_93705 [Endogone sp. FLAS-F59071]|eukprot:RUS14512.1 hypothetical protein BC937DRAFT_93705 [Endogone sp. FLAS-F59071]
MAPADLPALEVSIAGREKSGYEKTAPHIIFNMQSSSTPQEEKPQLREFESLRELRNRTEILIQVKHSIFQNNESLERKQALLDDVVSEKQQLLREKRVMMEMLQAIQRDIEAAIKAEQVLKKERDDLREVTLKLREEYEPLKSKVDSLRLEKGLKRLPNLQEELDTQMAKYLENRRERWREYDSEGSSENRGSPVAAGPSSSSNGGAVEAGSMPRRKGSTTRGRSRKRQR